MASLVFGTRTADTKNDSVINVSAISEALKPTPRLLDLRAGLLERIQPPERRSRRASVASPRQVPRIERPRPETARRCRRGARRGRARPSMVRIRIKHHLLQFPLGVARRLLNNLTTDINGDGVLRARDDDGRLVGQSRHGREAAALHDVDELAVPLVRRDGVLDVLI